MKNKNKKCLENDDDDILSSKQPSYYPSKNPSPIQSTPNQHYKKIYCWCAHCRASYNVEYVGSYPTTNIQFIFSFFYFDTYFFFLFVSILIRFFFCICFYFDTYFFLVFFFIYFFLYFFLF